MCGSRLNDEGDAPDIVVQKRRRTRAALNRLQQLVASQPVEPQSLLTDPRLSCRSALRVLGREGGIVLVAATKTKSPNASAGPNTGTENARLQITSFEAAFLTTPATIDDAVDCQRYLICQPTLRILWAQVGQKHCALHS
jgi:hypothetical protein